MTDIRSEQNVRLDSDWHGDRSADDQERYATSLASDYQTINYRQEGPYIAQELDEYQALFQEIVGSVRSATDQELALSYAAEWILDNDFLVITALRQIKEDFPPSYELHLPRLALEEQEGLLRAYALALSLVKRSKAQLNLERVQKFVDDFQKVTPLSMGELWALPVLLRLSVVQALILSGARLTGIKSHLEKRVVSERALELEISEDEVVANAFVSLRALAAQDWKDFFEGVSLVERILKDDPAQVYAKMDFETRDRYRKVVERLARSTKQDEQRVSQQAIRLAEANFTRRSEEPVGREKCPEVQQGSARLDRESHVGFYLVDEGRRELEEKIGYQPTGPERILRWAADRAAPLYLLHITGLAGLLLALIVVYAYNAGGELWQLLLTAVLGATPALAIAIHLVNWVITQLVPPRILPKMDYSDGLPEDYAALVAVPAMLTNSQEVASMLNQLELHCLRNPDPRLFFALLSDFPDASEPHLPEDEALVQQAVEGIHALNRKYPRPGGEPFLLLHRPRRLNHGEGKWIGWERKRGKLHELNQLILAARSHSKGKLLAAFSGAGDRQEDQSDSTGPAGFSAKAGPLEVLSEIDYIITLDADTVLPPGNACRLLATMVHPLNRPVFTAQGEICAGYSILQPRTEISPTSAVKSIFSRLFSGEVGLDLYTLAASDVYHDLFGEGIYVGKGIYAVEAFERSLAGTIPENSLLSHDLFEGIQGRAGLVTDIVLLEDYPSHYSAQARRMKRWIRGDWQLLPWLFPRVPGESGRVPNRLDLLDRWKILDNLRRSLVMPGLLGLFVAGWSGILPGKALFWTVVGLLPLVMPLFTDLIASLLKISQARRTSSLTWQKARSLLDSCLRFLLKVAFLPYEAILAIEAIAITVWRMVVSRRQLLRWTTAAQTERLFARRSGRVEIWMEIIAAPVSALSLAALLTWFRPGSLLVAAPLLALWLAGPEIAYWISLPTRTEVEPLSIADRSRLRQLASRTWLFFQQFVGPEDHWLPPDHYQEYPLGVVAHRTSPTNIGLNLLAILGAYDLGYIGLLNLSARLRNAFDTLAKLECYRGHFLNWYDTRTLEPLEPGYVSTVDSGNLVSSLIALCQGLLDLPAAPILRWEIFQGLLDGLSLLSEHLIELQSCATPRSVEEPLALIDSLVEQIRQVEVQPQEWPALLARLSSEKKTGRPGWGELDQTLLRFVEDCEDSLDTESIRRLRLYTQDARQRLENALREIDLLHPWIMAISQPPALFSQLEAFPGILAAWNTLLEIFAGQCSLGGIDEVTSAGQSALATIIDGLGRLEQGSAHGAPAPRISAALNWCRSLRKELGSAAETGKMLVAEFHALASEAEAIIQEMEFQFLFDPERKVFHIGFNRTLGRLDPNYYDLLASEARVASLVAIAKGEVPVSHWLQLGRPLNSIDGRPVLLSWSGTMFEYLMPLLLVRNYRETLLAQSAFSATDIQIEYGRSKGTAWGVSESGYYRFDPYQAYQYRAFGVPGLGFKRGLGDDLVITPYASLLALPLRPRAVLQNLSVLDELDAQGAFGFYEAVDFTPERLSMGKRHELVQEYMAHHQAMILLSLVNFLRGDSMVQRFHGDPRIRSVELLLQEQIPANAPLEQPHVEGGRSIRPQVAEVVLIPWKARVNAPQPRLHILSNGRYRLLITASGGGYSAWQEFDLTRWRSDITLDGWGTWIYIQDLQSHRLWSVGFEPTTQSPDNRDVYFNAHNAVFVRRDGDITAEMEIGVAPDEDVEVRHLILTNRGDSPRRLRLTSYAEVVLGSPAADQRHPAFSKLFVESQFLPGENALIFRRRPRSEDEANPYLAHALVVEDSLPRTGAFETDRARFLGRGGTSHLPKALVGDQWLSGAAGATLDPVMALGQELSLAPHASVRLAWITAVGTTRQGVIALVRRYSSWTAIDSMFRVARAVAEVELRQLGLQTTRLPRIQHLLSALLYPHDALRSPTEILGANRKGQPALWPYVISGDFPLMLVLLGSEEELPIALDLLQAYTYWRNRGFKIDLVFLNEQGTNYGQELDAQLRKAFARTRNDAWLNRRGGVFLLSADQLSPEDRILLQTVARVVIHGGQGDLEAQVTLRERLPARLPAFTASPIGEIEPEPEELVPRPPDLQFDNGLGGFSPDGREYVIYLDPGNSTPAPWINVIANPEFGCLVSESGLGYTWAVNSGENRLTPWSNDPVSDPAGEAIYLRDEETAEVWSPTPLPGPAPAPYLVRHGAGYSQFEHSSHGLRQRLRLFVIPGAPLKVLQLRLENRWKRVRRVTITYYAEWVLGVNREDTQQYIIPQYEGETQALLAYNPYNVEFGERVAFAAASRKLHGLTADRTEFLGRLGERALPAALRRIGLAGTVQPGLDPCAALQLHVDLQPGEADEVYFLLGQGADREEALELVSRYQQAGEVAAAWEAMKDSWDQILGAVSVRTPEPAMDLLLNRWLLYQALACRIWGRSAFYQSSGAYGFRDQLQDVMALVYAAPALAREHLLRAAAHQFEAGDVLHWWHPPSGRGVRTRFSDDLLWLPYVAAFYVTCTGDQAVLDEQVPFLTGPMLEPGQEERYGQYAATPQAYSLYDHCLRAIEKGATKGNRGLPLMGSGDWNDGMNRVGHEGRGESVWLAWFLIRTLRDFAGICERRGETAIAVRLKQQADEYAQAAEANAWDGAWYLRAYYDDGSPLGSSINRECQIDSIAQSWAALSAAGNPERTRQAMQSVYQRLVRQEDRLILLFTPPFNKTPKDPGYIKGYLPGVRENGGQYTHAAIWAVWVYAQLGQGDLAEALFRLLNPIYHADTPEKADRYKVEPYVIAADVYGAPPHTGRGGWTWYTGSSGWLYRLGLEAILGLRLEGKTFSINPCIPAYWPGFEIHLRVGETLYQIQVENPQGVQGGVAQVMLDGEMLNPGKIRLHDDGREHQVKVILGTMDGI